MIFHSHMDAGWIMTVEDYYQKMVKKIFSEVFIALDKDFTRKFTHAEIRFFIMWWEEQNDKTKAFAREMVKLGSFEFVNGGFVASDEACTNYGEIIQNI